MRKNLQVVPKKGSLTTVLSLSNVEGPAPTRITGH